MLTEYSVELGKLDEAIVWKEVAHDSPLNKRPWTLIAFGECGQGKSTALTKISTLYNNEFAK